MHEFISGIFTTVFIVFVFLFSSKSAELIQLIQERFPIPSEPESDHEEPPMIIAARKKGISTTTSDTRALMNLFRETKNETVGHFHLKWTSTPECDTECVVTCRSCGSCLSNESDLLMTSTPEDVPHRNGFFCAECGAGFVRSPDPNNPTIYLNETSTLGEHLATFRTARLLTLVTPHANS